MGYRVAVNCSGAAQTRNNSPDLQRRLILTARNAAIPVFSGKHKTNMTGRRQIPRNQHEVTFNGRLGCRFMTPSGT
jgi:hypothetical protein